MRVLPAESLLLDQQTTGAEARSLGWEPTRPSAVEEFQETVR